MRRLRAYVYGIVQGVGFRAFAHSEALRLGLKGYVRNCPDGSVEVVAEGPEEQLRAFLKRLWVGPIGARVDAVETFWEEGSNEYQSFTIRK
ncbi:MAG: acylphosphatase [Fimbriimonadales bacterium]|nr:acylphosphatase [Fimbriimonadales bacterium]MDW8051808.1 acylphosphatase [Armatimonadota bacterium]